MTVPESPWTVRLSASAESDFQQVIAWTLEQFGDQQARIYAETLSAAIAELLEGLTVAGVRKRREIGKALYTLRVARGGRRGRRFILFRVPSRVHHIDVLRLLHDAMDLKSHAP